MINIKDIVLPEYASGIDTSPTGAKAYLHATQRQGLDLHRRSTERWRMRVQDRKVESDIVGANLRCATNVLGSNLALRNIVGCLGIEHFAQMAARYPRRRFALATLISDRWLTFDRDTYLYLEGIKIAASAVLNLGGFSGWLAALEVQTLDESIRDLGRILLPNVHAIVWSDDPYFEFAEVERDLLRSTLLVSHTGAPTVTIERRADTAPTNLFAYLMKDAVTAKFRDPASYTVSGFRLRDCRLRPASAVRQHEVLSGTYLRELMFAGGEGADTLFYLDDVINMAVPERLGEIQPETAARFWDETRKRCRRDEYYYPVLIDRTGAQASPAATISLHAARFNLPT